MSVPGKSTFKLCLACIALLATGDRSSAQEIDWTTTYGGLQGGYSWTDTDISGIPAVDTLSFGEVNGGLVGVHSGWNPYQQDGVVIGLIADIYWSAASESKRQTSSVTTVTTTPVIDAPDIVVTTVRRSDALAKFHLHWKASLRAKAGALIEPNTLLFVTAGIAFARIELEYDAANTTTSTPGGTASSASFGNIDDILTGFVVGGGIETMIAPGVSAFAQTLYYEFDKDRLDLAGATASIDMREIAVMSGVSFHLN